MKEKNNKSNAMQIMGIPLGAYLIIFVIIVTGTYLNVIPCNFLTGFSFTMVVGCLLNWLGTRNKYVNMLGGPALLCLFVPTLCVYFGILPKEVVDFTNVFYTGTMGYIEYFIAALITGSILSMDRNILIKAGSRYAVPLIIGLIVSLGGAGIIGAISGYGSSEAIMYLAIPIMGGGIGAGAIPIASIYEGYGIGGSDSILSTLMPAVTLANIFAILIAVLLNALGKNPDRFFKGFSGQGQLMRTGEVFEVSDDKKTVSATFTNLGAGLLMSGTLYIFGYLLNKLVYAGVHAYAWTILTAAVLKITGVVPKKLEDAAGDWYGLISHIGVPTILVCVSLSSIDIPIILEAISNPIYLLITFIVTILACIGAGLGGRLMKMNFVEAGITAGLCMANTGGAGDVAVLGASDRMNLMPFAQISSRIGGALVLLIASFIVPFLV